MPRAATGQAGTVAESAVVVGAGHNGLVAANLLADAGWDVLVLEAQRAPAAPCHSDESLRPGSSPTGSAPSTRWARRRRSSTASSWNGTACAGRTRRRARAPLPDGRCAVLSRDLDDDGGLGGGVRAGRRRAWRADGRAVRADPRAADRRAVHPFPPVRAGLRLAARSARPSCCASPASRSLPVRRLGEERFARRGRAAAARRQRPAHRPARRSAPAAPSSAGCWRCSARPSASPCPWAGPAGSPPRWPTGCARRRRDPCQHAGRADRRHRRPGQRGRAARRHADRGAAAVLADVTAPALYSGCVGAASTCRRGCVDDLGRFEWDSAT